MRNINLFLISILQIFLLLNFVIAQSYIISEADNSIKEKIILEKSKEFLKDSVGFLVSFLSIKQIGFVSAINSCCEKTTEGAFCQMISGVDTCATGVENVQGDDCESTDYCKLGYCTDSDGDSSAGYEIQCPGSWSATEPDMGCCSIRENTWISTQAWCTEHNGGEITRGLSASQCVYYSPDKIGACVYENAEGIKMCSFESEEACKVDRAAGNPVFNVDKLCSNTGIGIDTEDLCEKQKSIDCYNNQIYWYDSCGNRENVYTGDDATSRDQSWSSGLVYKSSLCSVETDGAECGECDGINNICKSTTGTNKVAAGNFICKDLGCEEEDGTIRQNMESWCVYESKVGEASLGEVTLATCTKVDWKYEDDDKCKAGNKGEGDFFIRKWTKIGFCEGGESHPLEEKIKCDNFCENGEIHAPNNYCECCPKNKPYFDSLNGECTVLGCDNIESPAYLCDSIDYCLEGSLDIKNNDITEEDIYGVTPHTIEDIIISEGNPNKNISADLPGTRHFLKTCNQGEINTISCGDYRTSICGESVTDDGISVADCRLNLGLGCFGIETKEECESEPDCRMHKVDAADHFKFEACVPKYPMGFEDPEIEESICGIGTQTCMVVEQKKIKTCNNGLWSWPCGTHWVYVANKECDTNPGEFYNQMNDFCMSLGDCGESVNVMGDYKGRADIFWPRYKILNDISESYGDKPIKIGGDPSFGNIEDIRNNFAVDGRENIEPGENEGNMGNFKSALQVISAAGVAYGAISGGHGYAIAAVAALILISLEIIFPGLSDDPRKTPITFTCKPWEPPFTEGNCGKCNEGELPCSKNFCESLGKCEIIKDVSGLELDEPLCVEKYDISVGAPIISFKEVSVGYKGDDTTNINGVSITNLDDTCIESDTLVNVILETDKDDENRYSRCLWNYFNLNDLNPLEDYKTAWANNMPESGSSLSKIHNFSIRTAYYEKTVNGKYVVEPIIDATTGDEMPSDFNIYVVCEGNNGESNTAEYVINFCVNPEPDINPPIIERIQPENGFLTYGATTFGPIKVFTNEIVKECRYSMTDMLYEEMTPVANMAPVTSVCSSPGTGIVNPDCEFNGFTGLTEEENKIYFRCGDESGNNMNTSKVYTISQSQGALKIDTKSPSGIQPRGRSATTTDPASYPMDLEITTSGGWDGNGFATCYFNWSWKDLDINADGKWHKFLNTNDGSISIEDGLNEHLQIESLYAGDYSIPIKCVDAVGNINDTVTIDFTLTIDEDAPEIATIYREEDIDKLIVTTYEASRCYYNTTANCPVSNMGDATNKMQDGIAAVVEHNVEWNSELTYRIQCIDDRENLGNCITIAPSYF